MNDNGNGGGEQLMPPELAQAIAMMAQQFATSTEQLDERRLRVAIGCTVAQVLLPELARNQRGELVFSAESTRHALNVVAFWTDRLADVLLAERPRQGAPPWQFEP